MHEILIGIPTKNLSGMAFFGMLSQIPLILFTASLDSIRKRLFPQLKGQVFDTLGNLVFWTSFTVFGQPVCVVAYYFMWQKRFAS
ncbi:hypothetical protein HDU91_004748 [Kappamyces sp. JEL0680]|nr:hypothetical protein HDU91_004748 [Kappamyces sp. JEL0680]